MLSSSSFLILAELHRQIRFRDRGEDVEIRGGRGAEEESRWVRQRGRAVHRLSLAAPFLR